MNGSNVVLFKFGIAQPLTFQNYNLSHEKAINSPIQGKILVDHGKVIPCRLFFVKTGDICNRDFFHSFYKVFDDASFLTKFKILSFS